SVLGMGSRVVRGATDDTFAARRDSTVASQELRGRLSPRGKKSDTAARAEASAKAVSWLLLIHQIPPKPNYLRVKVWRRLQRLGAVPIKNSVYVLPKSDQAQEDLQWLLREITEGGGEGTVCEARFVEGLSDAQVEALFHS